MNVSLSSHEWIHLNLWDTIYLEEQVGVVVEPVKVKIKKGRMILF